MQEAKAVAPSIIRKIEEFFTGDEKSRQACLNLATYLFGSAQAIQEMSLVDVADAMDAEDPKTVLTCLDFCAGPLGLIDTYAVVHLEGKDYELTIDELNQAVRSGRVSNPKTGAKQVFSYLRHPLYKMSTSLVSQA